MAQREMEDTRFIKMIVDIEKNSEANWQGCHRFHSKNLKRSVPESFLWKFKKQSYNTSR